MARGEYFRVDPGSNRVDSRPAEEETSCCGVNLAFAVFGVGALGLGLWGWGFGVGALGLGSFFPRAVQLYLLSRIILQLFGTAGPCPSR
jgi:hypothetical protein